MAVLADTIALPTLRSARWTVGNQTVNHVLLECPLHQDERDWMRNVLSDQGIALRRGSGISTLPWRRKRGIPGPDAGHTTDRSELSVS
ncbi:uncharacterized protein ASPGLDRAFT_48081 [Aspergillus glaucus CBS 516.65]|uniref:Uncharacterized protein n=1 Tax=Aspergillus glaucus CBS 516.65 TaxID=1160497 RepID=A0A1L9VI07_ASPGL|nr:hypothetical protein ASPGLDRAFT_48081 [Aspergillus glaucus CBS 516.65]OJJ83530.1 hypothetical protein ASPGLDRAFT_48081 [Aspergillus glaucus CBS 516.65]